MSLGKTHFLGHYHVRYTYTDYGKECMDTYRKKIGLAWEELFRQIEEETGYSCPRDTEVGWLHGNSFPRQARGVFSK